MPISVSTISKEQKSKILALPEGHFVEVKAIDVSPARLTIALSAFANADGGELYIGIDENKDTGELSWRGFPNQEAANGHIQTFEPLFPLDEGFKYSFLACEGCSGLVLQILVQKTRDIKHTSDNKIFLRRGAQSLLQDTEEKRKRLELNKGITSFETQTVSCEPSLITNSLNIIRFLLEVIPTAEPEAWLRSQQLLHGDSPTVASILLFAEEPQAILPKRCGISIYRYKTRNKEGSRETLATNPIAIEGCIYDQIKTAVNTTVEIIESTPVLGTEGLEKFEYPRTTLHEIITNAVLHRDYSIRKDIHIRIFDNRIEVESPGRLPGHITVNNILEEQFARNGGLVRLIYKFPNPPNKDVGEGLNTAFDAMRELKLKTPTVHETDTSVVVDIRHEPLARPEELVLDYLKTNSEINNRTARKICYIGDANQMKDIFQRLMKNGQIERIVGPGRSGGAAAYQLKQADKSKKN